MRGASEPPQKLWQQRLSADSDFCRAVVANGYMSEEQMQQAVQRYRLGCSRDGGVIFWQIDTLGHEYDGKIMYYRPDCHRDHQRHPQWVSNLLKRQFVQRFPEMAAWMPETHHCLFGTHLLSLADGADDADVLNTNLTNNTNLAVVEAEKTAVILSAHYPCATTASCCSLTPTPTRRPTSVGTPLPKRLVASTA